MSTAAEPLPAEEVEVAVPKGFELIDGRLVEKPVSTESAWVGGEVFARLREYVLGRGAGFVFPAETIYRCFPDRPKLFRKPDASFVTRDRYPQIVRGPGDLTVAPDLIVEVVSPNEEVYELNRRIADFLGVGTRLVWVIDPDTRTVVAYRSDGTARRLTDADELTGEGVLPDFRCPIRDILPPAEAEATP